MRNYACIGMSQEFNKFFGSVFTKETSGEVPGADWMYKENDRGLCDIEITEKIDEGADQQMPYSKGVCKKTTGSTRPC